MAAPMVAASSRAGTMAATLGQRRGLGGARQTARQPEEAAREQQIEPCGKRHASEDEGRAHGHMPWRSEPGDRFGEALARGPRLVAQLVLCLGRAEEHLLPRHAQPVERDERLVAGRHAPCLGGNRHRPDRGDRQAECRRLAAADAGDVVEDFGERHVVAAKDVALADPAVALGQKMARRHVVDMDEVEAGIDESGHAARRGLDDHAAGRRRLDVARADRRRGIDDDRRQAALHDEALHRVLGQEFRALVGADHVLERAWASSSSAGTPVDVAPKVATLLV